MTIFGKILNGICNFIAKTFHLYTPLPNIYEKYLDQNGDLNAVALLEEYGFPAYKYKSLYGQTECSVEILRELMNDCNYYLREVNKDIEALDRNYRNSTILSSIDLKNRSALSSAFKFDELIQDDNEYRLKRHRLVTYKVALETLLKQNEYPT